MKLFKSIIFFLIIVEIEKPSLESSETSTPISTTESNVASSTNEEQQSETVAVSNTNEEKFQTKDQNNEQEQYKFIPIERKPEYTFTILITSQGQEVLKSIDCILRYLRN